MRKLLLIVPVVLAAFLLAACSDLDSESTVTPAMSPIAASVAVDTSTPTTAPVAISAADVIAGVVDAMRQVTSLHFEMESRVSVTVQETSLTIPLKLSADYVAPDQVAGTLSATIAFVIFETQVVAIGNELYVTDPIHEVVDNRPERSFTANGFKLARARQWLPLLAEACYPYACARGAHS